MRYYYIRTLLFTFISTPIEKRQIILWCQLYLFWNTYRKDNLMWLVDSVKRHTTIVQYSLDNSSLTGDMTVKKQLVMREHVAFIHEEWNWNYWRVVDRLGPLWYNNLLKPYPGVEISRYTDSNKILWFWQFRFRLCS